MTERVFPTESPTQIAATALALFRRRQEKAAEALRSRAASHSQCHRALRPWAAMALLAGADAWAIFPDLGEALADLRIDVRSSGPGDPAYPPTNEAEARKILADELAHRREWAPLITAACKKALADNSQEAAALIALARHLKVQPVIIEAYLATLAEHFT